MKSVLLRATGAALLAIATSSATPAAAATGWTDPVRISAPPTVHGGTFTTDQTSDGAGNVHVAYAQCGEVIDPFTFGCSLQLVTRDAATGDWTEPDTLAAAVANVEGPAAIDIEANAAGDVVVGWQTCGYASDDCAPMVAMRPRGNAEWTPPVPVVTPELEHDNDWNHSPDVALGEDGKVTVAWNRSHRHGSSSVTTVEVLARSAAVDDAGAANPELVFAATQTIAPSDPAASNDRTDAPVIVTTDDGTTVAAWWYKGGGACHQVRYAVQPAGGAWGSQQAIGGGDCATATSFFMTPGYALAAAGDDAVLVYSATVTDETGATDGTAGTWATTIGAAGTTGPTTKLSDRIFTLAVDPTSGDGDLTRAQFAQNANGELALAAYEDADGSSSRPVVVVRDDAGSWGPVVPADSAAAAGAVGTPAPGVAIDGAGTVTLAWSANLATATPEDPWASDQAIRVAHLARGATSFATPGRLSPPDRESTRPLVSNGPGGSPIITWRQADPNHTHLTALHSTEPTTAPDASFTWTPALPVAGEPVTFTSTSTDPDDDPATLTTEWDFNGDGDFTDATGSPAITTFTVAGDYDVELRVTDGDEQVDYAMRVVVIEGDTPTGSAPVAGFGWTPNPALVGQKVVFSSFTTDPDDDVVALHWDLDGDGQFDDASGEHVEHTFTTAGPKLVGLRAEDAAGNSDEHTAMVLVNSVGSPPSDGGGDKPPVDDPPVHKPPTDQPPVDAHTPDPPKPPALPHGFVVTRTVDTNGARTMPAVAGRALDDARARTIRALVHADVKLTPRASDASKLGKRPGGGKWKTGDVIEQTPAAGTKLQSGASNPSAVTLTYWSGAKSGKKKCDELRAAVKGDDLDLALAQLKAAKCGAPDLKLKASKKATEPTVKSLSRDRDDMTVTVPVDQAKTDIVIWKNTGFLGTNDPGPVPSAHGDLQLTAGQQNVAGVILRDRAGQPLNRASVTWDLSGVGGSEKTTKSIESGVAPVKLTPEKAGTVRVLVSWSDSVGETIYGYTEFKVVDRFAEPGFVTAIGQSFKRSGSGKSATFKPGTFKSKAGKRASIGGFFDLVAQCIRDWGGAVGSAVNATAEGVFGVAKKFGASVAQLWRGPVNGPPQAAQPKFTSAGMWLVQPSGVVSAGGGNVVAAGGMNVISAGGGNVVAAGGMNVIAAGGGNVVSAGGGNIITLPDGAKVVSAGGGNVVAAGGMNVIAAGGGNVVAAGGLN